MSWFGWTCGLKSKQSEVNYDYETSTIWSSSDLNFIHWFYEFLHHLGEGMERNQTDLIVSDLNFQYIYVCFIFVITFSSFKGNFEILTFSKWFETVDIPSNVGSVLPFVAVPRRQRGYNNTSSRFESMRNCFGKITRTKSWSISDESNAENLFIRRNVFIRVCACFRHHFSLIFISLKHTFPLLSSWSFARFLLIYMTKQITHSKSRRTYTKVSASTAQQKNYSSHSSVLSHHVHDKSQ